MTLSRLAREEAINAITANEPVVATASVASRAIALRAVLDQPVPLSARERALMEEWLERITAANTAQAPR